ncbi:MAG: putative maltokinase, partial [Elusimicrobia bacterium]|nr:putative maltokinase [Elusimicrobiota bacterium]
LLNSLLFSLPGTPVLYYGDEIGMGDNIHLGDRNGVRTPMLWNADRNAGFSRANAQSLYLPIIIEPEYHYEAVNVEVQQNNQHSLFWWMKRAIDMRKRYKAFGRGTMELVGCENRKILAYVRAYEEERILAVANLSRFVQLAELDLSPFKGLALVEMFGRFEFPPVTDERYRLTLGPHSFYWFRLRPPTATEVNPALAPGQPLTLAVSGGHESIFSSANAAALGAALQSYLRARQWFEGRQHLLRSARILDDVALPGGGTAAARLCLVQAEFLNASPEVYLLPLAITAGEKAAKIRQEHPFSVLAEIRSKSGKNGGSILFDAAADPEFSAGILEGVRAGCRLKGRSGEVAMAATEALAAALDATAPPAPAPVKGSRRNASVLFGDRLVLKFFRRLHEGENPDAEISRHLAGAKGFAYSPALAGEITYRPRQGPSRTLAVLHCYVPNRGDAWQYTLDALRRYFDDLPGGLEFPKDAALAPKFWTLAEADPPPLALERVGSYLETAKLLGQRTAELHRALASGAGEKNFAPESFGELYQRSLYQSLRNRAKETFYLLRRKAKDLPAAHHGTAAAALALESEALTRLRGLLGQKLSGRRIRCHGDYHLKQVLYTGGDFQIFDFEGPAEQPLEERRIKRSPLRDAAGMLRSFDYAVYTILLGRVGVSREADAARLEPWARFWSQWASASFWKSYLAAMEGSGLLPKTGAETDAFLEILLIERALDEVRQELDSSPEWAVIPLTGFLRLLGPQDARSATRSAA